MEKLGLPVPEQSAAGTYYGGGSGGTGSGAEDAVESTLYQTLYQAGLRSEAEAYEWLVRNGYNATQAEKLAGYFGGLVDDGAFEAGEEDAPRTESAAPSAGTGKGTTGKMNSSAALKAARASSNSEEEQLMYLVALYQSGQITEKQLNDLTNAMFGPSYK